MCKNFPEFFYSCKALDHEVQCVVLGIVIDFCLGLRGACLCIPGLIYRGFT